MEELEFGLKERFLKETDLDTQKRREKISVAKNVFSTKAKHLKCAWPEAEIMKRFVRLEKMRRFGEITSDK